MYKILEMNNSFFRTTVSSYLVSDFQQLNKAKITVWRKYSLQIKRSIRDIPCKVVNVFQGFLSAPNYSVFFHHFWNALMGHKQSKIGNCIAKRIILPNSSIIRKSKTANIKFPQKNLLMKFVWQWCLLYFKHLSLVQFF